MNFTMPWNFALEKNYVFYLYTLHLVKYNSGQMFFLYILGVGGCRSDWICFKNSQP
jgi:hypothetical protein